MDQPLTDFLHRGPLELMWMTFFGRGQPYARATPKLLGPLCRDVNEQKPALDECRRIDRFLRGGVVLRIRHAADEIIT